MKPKWYGLINLGIGLAAGSYALGFWGLAEHQYILPVALSWGKALLCLAVGVIAVALEQAVLAKIFHQGLGLPQVRSLRIILISDLPLLLLPLAWLILPFLAVAGKNLNLEVLGHIYLPFFQGSVHLPAVGYLYLLWFGPWYVLCWFLKILLASRAWCQEQEKSSHPKPLKNWALLSAAFGFYAMLCLWSAMIYPATGDEPHYLLMTHSLIHERDIDLADNMARKDFQFFYPGPELDFHGSPTPGGILLSKHFPLLSVGLIPGYAALGRLGASLTLAILAAASAWVIFLLCQGLGFSQRQALYAWLAAVVSVPLAIYYDLVFPEIPALLLFLLAMWGMTRGRAKGAWLMALAIGLLPWLYLKFIPLAALLALLFFQSPSLRWKDRIWALLAMAGSGLLFMMFFRTHYGFSLSGNPYGDFYPLFSKHSLANALGLLVDRDFGIFSASPILLVGLMGWLHLAKNAKQLTAAALAAGLIQYFMFVVFVDFTGSSATFSRQMIVGSMLLFVGVIPGWDFLQTRGWFFKVLGWLCAAASVILAWLNAGWPMLRYLSPKQQLWAKLPFAPSVFPSLAEHTDNWTLAWAAAWVLMLAILVVAAARPFSRPMISLPREK